MSSEKLRERLAKIEGLKTGADLLREQIDKGLQPLAPDAKTPEDKGLQPLAVASTTTIPGTEAENDFGTYQLAETRLPLDSMHGSDAIGTLLNIEPANLALAARMNETDLDFRRAIFLDTETTSLDSGAGVHVFLIGTGHFEDTDFVVRQYFMRDPAEEMAMLHDFAQEVESFDLAVSFFGKNFDLPRITDRFNLNRMPLNFPAAHVDLCHVGRRIWVGRYGNCQLQTLERRVLKFVRENDLPGAECPRAWFEYVNGMPSRIADVFHHNLLDVVSMATLTARIDREVADPQDPIVKANVARILEDAGRTDDALHLYEAAKEGLWPPPDLCSTKAAVKMMKRLSVLYRRRNDWDNATLLWQEQVDRGMGGHFPHERLSVYYEHVERDFDLAVEHAHAALTIASETRGSASTLASLQRRIERLGAKRGTDDD